MPVSLTKDINLITRPVIQLYNSVPFTSMTGKEVRTTTFGDWTQLELFSPANSGNWLLGIGPTFIFPTAGSFYTAPFTRARENGRSVPRWSWLT